MLAIGLVEYLERYLLDYFFLCFAFFSVSCVACVTYVTCVTCWDDYLIFIFVIVLLENVGDGCQMITIPILVVCVLIVNAYNPQKTRKQENITQIQIQIQIQKKPIIFREKKMLKYL